MAERAGGMMKKLLISLSLVLIIAFPAYGAGNIYKNFGSTAQIEGAGDGYTTLAGSAEEYTSVVDFVTLGYEGALITIHAYDTGSASTSGTGVSVYYYHEDPTDSTEIYGSITVPTISFELPAVPATTGVTRAFLVTDALFFAIGMHELTAGDDFDVRIYVRPWRWQFSRLFMDAIKPEDMKEWEFNA